MSTVGQKLAEEGIAALDCFACQKKLSRSVIFCPYCGKSQRKHAAILGQPNVTAPPLEAAPAAQPQGESPTVAEPVFIAALAMDENALPKYEMPEPVPAATSPAPRIVSKKYWLWIAGSICAAAIGVSIIGHGNESQPPALTSTEPATTATPSASADPCQSHKTWVSRAFCQDPALEKKAEQFSDLVKTLSDGAGRDQIRRQLPQWRLMRNACKAAPAPTVCLNQVYDEQIAILNAKSATSQPTSVPQTTSDTMAAAQSPLPATETSQKSFEASAPPAKSIVGTPVIIDTGHIRIGDADIRLDGINGIDDMGALELERKLIARDGGSVTCIPALSGYQCLTGNGNDLAATAIRNGAGRASNTATADYREQESLARSQRRGIWSQVP